jgi:hypothetical protein
VEFSPLNYSHFHVYKSISFTTECDKGLLLYMGAEPYIGCPYPCPCPWVLGGHGLTWVGIAFVHPCIQLRIGVKLLECKEYANQEALRAEASDSERPFICPIQPRLGVGG